MHWMDEKPTLNQVIASVLSTLALIVVSYIALQGDAAAKTALISFMGAASGTYFLQKATNGTGNSTGNGNGQPKP